jgi:hypothetical protein
MCLCAATNLKGDPVLVNTDLVRVAIGTADGVRLLFDCEEFLVRGELDAWRSPQFTVRGLTQAHLDQIRDVLNLLVQAGGPQAAVVALAASASGLLEVLGEILQGRDVSQRLGALFGKVLKCLDPIYERLGSINSDEARSLQDKMKGTSGAARVKLLADAIALLSRLHKEERCS